MQSLLCVVLALVGSFVLAHLVQAQNQQGFISLDCGLPIDGSPYVEPSTRLSYTSDANFVEGGRTGTIDKGSQSSFIKPYQSLRYFPDGTRNCYNLNVTKGTNYLIKATFVYGNYDGQNNYPSFDLYLGPNKWDTIDLQGKENGIIDEIIHVPKSNYLQICLVKTGATAPLISAIELRPLRKDIYNTQSGSLKYLFRVYSSNSTGDIRYPDDIYDRKWYSHFQKEWTQITTTFTVNTSNIYNPPENAMQTAATPTNTSAPLTLSWTLPSPATKFYLYIHFADIQNLKAKDIREFNLVMNGKLLYGPYSPLKLKIYTLYYTEPGTCQGGQCLLQFVKTPRSTLPPLVNAMEAFTVIDFPQSETNQSDVAAIKNIEAIYRLSRISWQGDPCVPEQYIWDGLNCSNSDILNPPRIISLNLSSSGLTGLIAPDIGNLSELQQLDLSNNNLTGGVPEFLANMNTLQFINLSGNNLNGSVPQALLDKENKGLKLNVEGNPNLSCPHGSCKNQGGDGGNKKKKFIAPAVASVVSVAVIAVLVLVFVVKKKKPSKTHARPSTPEMDARHFKSSDPSIITKERKFTYSEVQAMTDDFQSVLGKGGFGVVYHGYVNNTEQVAVKMLSQASVQGYKQFKAEVELLLRVHHKNLVSLVGYCDNGDNLALIYEYMANGDLKEHLSGKRGGSVLSWASRLKIAVESAQGLEYLHNGCKPPIVHRDVKSTNILLNEHFQAKLADFGLSRSFPIEGETHVSTVVAGTPGYLDPEYYRTNWLTEKSDVFSFGIVILELMTNRPVIDKNRERPHLAEWVGSMLSRGDIQNIMDPTLQGDYDSSSVWKAVELAMSCLNPSSAGRPNMSQVVAELNQCLANENSKTGESRATDSKSSLELSMSFGTEVFPSAR